MKRMLALLLALMMGLSLAACAGEEAPVSQSGTESPAPAESAEPSLTPAPEGARTCLLYTSERCYHMGVVGGKPRRKEWK